MRSASGACEAAFPGWCAARCISIRDDSIIVKHLAEALLAKPLRDDDLVAARDRHPAMQGERVRRAVGAEVVPDYRLTLPRLESPVDRRKVRSAPRHAVV